MTRKEVEKHLQLCKIRGQADGDFYESDIDELIDKIYDDFESRTCKNCVSYIDTLGVCLSLKAKTTLNFGCNKWESLDVNNTHIKSGKNYE